MIFARKVSAFSVGTAFALSLLFACANSEVASGPPPSLAPDAGPQVVPDAEPDAADVPDATAAVPGKCSRGGFCYVSMPVLAPLIAVSASSIDDAWMLPKDTQTILRWDGTSLKEVYEYTGTTPETITFRAIWAEKKDNVWAVATDEDRYYIVRYAPTGGGPAVFREYPTEQLAPIYTGIAWGNSVWGTPSSDALWVAAGSAILRFRDNGSGSGSGSGALAVDRFVPLSVTGGYYQWFSVWGFGDKDVYLGGGEYAGSVSRAAIAHYDGTAWSIKTFDSGNESVYSLRGTPVGQPRQLWSTRWQDPRRSSTRILPIGAAGQLGEELLVSEMPACNGRFGGAATPMDGWFSNGLLVCRWTGTKFEDVPTSVGGLPVVQQVNGVWAGSADDAWIVGASATGRGGFAALRTRATAEGGKP